MRRSEQALLGERVWGDTLPCGLELYLVPKQGFRSSHALLVVGYGSIDRCFVPPGNAAAVEVPDGVAHFLEHRLFAGPKGDVGELFASLGAEVNAHTTFTHTAYFFSCADRLEECLALLLDFVFALQLTPEGVEREREIIARELQLYGDHLEWVSFFSALQSLYGGHPLGVDIAGTPESLRRIDREVLELCHRSFYHPGNMALFIGGDIEAEALREVVNGLMEDRGFAPRSGLRRLACPDSGGGPRVMELPIAVPRLCLGFRDREAGLRGGDLLRGELALELALDILFGASSDFYARHYESGLIDAESFGCEVYAEPEFCFCLVGGDTRHPGLLQEALLEELRRARRGDLIERHLARARRRAYGQLLQRLDQVESCVGLIHSAISRGGGPFDLFAAHEQVGVAQVYACLDTCLDPDRCQRSEVVPSGEEG